MKLIIDALGLYLSMRSRLRPLSQVLDCLTQVRLWLRLRLITDWFSQFNAGVPSRFFLHSDVFQSRLHALLLLEE